MPFDYVDYQRKVSSMPPEALQREWENYTRQIAGGATSTGCAVLFSPLTAGVSLVGLGLSAPRIHNARKKREIIESHMQAQGIKHTTRKRDVIAPAAIAGTLGGLTLGLAGPGADLIAGEAVGKGAEYVVAHVALDGAGAALEHTHDKHTKTKVELELAQKHGYHVNPNGKYMGAYQPGMMYQPGQMQQGQFQLQQQQQYASVPIPGAYGSSGIDQNATYQPPQAQAQAQQQQLPQYAPQQQAQQQQQQLPQFVPQPQDHQQQLPQYAPQPQAQQQPPHYPSREEMEQQLLQYALQIQMLQQQQQPPQYQSLQDPQQGASGQYQSIQYQPPSTPAPQYEQYQQFQQQVPQQENNFAAVPLPNYDEKSSAQSYLQEKPTQQIQVEQENGQSYEKRSESPQKLPFVGLPDEEEAEGRGLQWDGTRGMYVRPENANLHTPGSSASTPVILPAALAVQEPSVISDMPKQMGNVTITETTINVEEPTSQAEVTLSETTVQVQVQQPPAPKQEELDDLMLQLLVETSTGPGEPTATPTPAISFENTGNQSTPQRIQVGQPVQPPQRQQQQQLYPTPQSQGVMQMQNDTLLSPAGSVHGQFDTPVLPLNVARSKTPTLPPRPQSAIFESNPSLPPRPLSAMQSYPTSEMQRKLSLQQSFPPPPPPPTTQQIQQQVQRHASVPTSTPQTSLAPGQYYAPAPVRPQAPPQPQYSAQQYFPQYSPSVNQNSFQAHPPPPQQAQFPQYQPHQFQPQQAPLNRPSPQPLQHQYNHRDSVSSISTVSSASTNLSYASTVSSVSTPLTQYSTPTSSVYDPNASRRNSSISFCTSPPPTYFPPAPSMANQYAPLAKQKDYFNQGAPQGQGYPQMPQGQGYSQAPQGQGWNNHAAAPMGEPQYDTVALPHHY